MIRYRIGRPWLLSRFERQGSKHGMDPNFSSLFFLFSIFNIQVDSFVFSRWTRNFAKKKKIETPFISRIKLKFLIFQYISLVSLLSSLVKRIFSCEFLIRNNRWNFVWTLSYMCISIHICINWRLFIY